jgi:hypothetical protein
MGDRSLPCEPTAGLRQITSYRGIVTEPDGTVTVELPGPIQYSKR